YERMNTSFESLGSNPVSFITFNYDRSVEHFLYTSILKTYNKGEESTAQQVRRISVVHLHGRLGRLPWEADTATRPYRGDQTPQTVQIASDGIKIIHEDPTG